MARARGVCPGAETGCGHRLRCPCAVRTPGPPGAPPPVRPLACAPTRSCPPVRPRVACAARPVASSVKGLP
eukprot:5453902-Pleurochrysis_carterae.AAC.1